VSDDYKANILVVDDLPDKLLAYRSILESLGQNLITVGSGEEALKEILQRDFAVVLLDVNMPPGMSGLETAALIRKRKRSALTPIIFLTAFADEVRVAEGYAHGAVDYILTPVVPDILRAKVRVFVDLYRMTQQVKRQAEERVALAEERTKRTAAEEANRRLAFLTRAGAVLGQSLDYEVTARDVARVPVPYLAEVAAVAVPHRGSWKAVVAHAGPVLEDAVGRDGLPDDWAAGIDRVLAGEETRAEGSLAVVPLRARGSTLGALLLSREKSGRAFDPTDLTVAEALASRAASALENARLYKDVETADRQKNEFLSMLAHELRNPLAPIRNAAEVLRLSGVDHPRVRWARDIIDRQVAHLVRLVDDLLDVSRITKGKIRLQTEEVDLAAVVTQAVEASRPLIDARGHRLEVSLPPGRLVVSGDPARLTQVLTNLLNNAAKYTDEGGRIWLTVSAEHAAQNAESPPGAAGAGLHSECRGLHSAYAVIRVRDNGIGIPPDMLAAVFDLFTQVDASLERSQGGLGIGLTLVRRLVEMHGGRVEVRSDGPGQGSEFTVWLAMTAAATALAAAGPSAAGSVPPNRLRIVIADDNEDGAESLAGLLRLDGHEVFTAHDGEAAVERVFRHRPDVAIVDIGMPRLNGYEVARRLRASPDACPAVLLALSGYGREEDFRQAREAGFDHHFVKPIDLASVRQLLVLARPRPAAARRR
jgi:signal transduction histidine kinase/DNA-binding response OmpR family regulator